VSEIQDLNDHVYFCPFRESTGGVDDTDGYLIVEPGDHILYRFEVKSVLGKGSFAQVVSAYDHKEKQKVALKINRNTEIDHKFAQSEAKILKLLMKEDPDDLNNIVRMQ
jgi:dual specificity tyrosine-phosphorylation-regulated kinase 2/3/4